MEFKDVTSLTLIKDTAIVNGVEIQIDTTLPANLTAVQFHSGRDYCIEEPNMERVELTKYQYALDEFEEKADLLKNPVYTLRELKDKQTLKINSSCKSAIVSGFPSSALGSEHIYQSEETDQLNLIGVVLDGTDASFKCGIVEIIDDKEITTWSWKAHTIEQLKTVFSDGKKRKEELLLQANTLKVQIENATTKEAVEAIVWEEV